jgi:hypothetical protein
MEFFLEFWPEILLAVITAAGTITGLTSSEKDDNLVDLLKRILNAILLGRSIGPKNKE